MTIPDHSAPPRKFSLDELCTLTTLSVRTVRYYIQIGLLDRPEGEKRGAHYLERHLDQLLRIKQLSEAGISLERIREVLHGQGEIPVPPRRRQPGQVNVRSHVWLAAGLELVIDPEEARLGPEQLRALINAVTTAYQSIQKAEDET